MVRYLETFAAPVPSPPPPLQQQFLVGNRDNTGTWNPQIICSNINESTNPSFDPNILLRHSGHEEGNVFVWSLSNSDALKSTGLTQIRVRWPMWHGHTNENLVLAVGKKSEEALLVGPEKGAEWPKIETANQWFFELVTENTDCKAYYLKNETKYLSVDNDNFTMTTTKTSPFIVTPIPTDPGKYFIYLQNKISNPECNVKNTECKFCGCPPPPPASCAENQDSASCAASNENCQWLEYAKGKGYCIPAPPPGPPTPGPSPPPFGDTCSGLSQASCGESNAGCSWSEAKAMCCPPIGCPPSPPPGPSPTPPPFGDTCPGLSKTNCNISNAGCSWSEAKAMCCPPIGCPPSPPSPPTPPSPPPTPPPSPGSKNNTSIILSSISIILVMLIFLYLIFVLL